MRSPHDGQKLTNNIELNMQKSVEMNMDEIQDGTVVGPLGTELSITASIFVFFIQFSALPL